MSAGHLFEEVMLSELSMASLGYHMAANFVAHGIAPRELREGMQVFGVTGAAVHRFTNDALTAVVQYGTRRPKSRGSQRRSDRLQYCACPVRHSFLHRREIL